MPLTMEQKESGKKLSEGYTALALRLQEASSDLSASTIGRKLSAAVEAAHKGTGRYGYYIDHVGDDSDGDVIYSCDGNTMACPYEMQGNGEGMAHSAVIDTDAARKVSGRMVYEDEPEDEDGYAAMQESFRREHIYSGDVPLFERFVSKDERTAADESDFAGKGKSYPILKPADMMAAVRSIGRAGSGNYDAGTLKRNIIRIAKRKGWAKYLPKAWQVSGEAPAKESRRENPVGGDALRLVEGAGFCQEIPLVESARTTYPIKLISPGAGTSAYYTADALKESASLFKPGTLMFWNHPTASEESARPEGDLNNLAAITTKPAEWRDSGPKGPGLYAEAKVMGDYAERLQERAPHIGVSIRAGGESTGRMIEGKPELKKITYVESVDYVTKAGRGGLALAEAARNAGLLPLEESMDADELTLLRETVAKLSGKELRREAIQEGARVLRGVNLRDEAKEYIIETVLKEALPVKDGALDTVRLTEAINAEARRFGAAIGATPQVTGMGVAAPVVEITEAQRKAQQEFQNAETERLREGWATLLGEQPDANGNFRLTEAALKGRVN